MVVTKHIESLNTAFSARVVVTINNSGCCICSPVPSITLGTNTKSGNLFTNVTVQSSVIQNVECTDSIVQFDWVFSLSLPTYGYSVNKLGTISQDFNGCFGPENVTIEFDTTGTPCPNGTITATFPSNGFGANVSSINTSTIQLSNSATSYSFVLSHTSTSLCCSGSSPTISSIIPNGTGFSNADFDITPSSGTISDNQSFVINNLDWPNIPQNSYLTINTVKCGVSRSMNINFVPDLCAGSCSGPNWSFLGLNLIGDIDAITSQIVTATSITVNDFPNHFPNTTEIGEFTIQLDSPISSCCESPVFITTNNQYIQLDVTQVQEDATPGQFELFKLRLLATGVLPSQIVIPVEVRCGSSCTTGVIHNITFNCDGGGYCYFEANLPTVTVTSVDYTTLFATIQVNPGTFTGNYEIRYRQEGASQWLYRDSNGIEIFTDIPVTTSTCKTIYEFRVRCEYVGWVSDWVILPNVEICNLGTGTGNCLNIHTINVGTDVAITVTGSGSNTKFNLFLDLPTCYTYNRYNESICNGTVIANNFTIDSVLSPTETRFKAVLAVATVWHLLNSDLRIYIGTSTTCLECSKLVDLTTYYNVIYSYILSASAIMPLSTSEISTFTQTGVSKEYGIQLCDTRLIGIKLLKQVNGKYKLRFGFLVDGGYFKVRIAAGLFIASTTSGVEYKNTLSIAQPPGATIIDVTTPVIISGTTLLNFSGDPEYTLSEVQTMSIVGIIEFLNYDTEATAVIASNKYIQFTFSLLGFSGV